MNGILVVNKSVDYTSRDIVNILSRKFNTRHIGHTGTLDPMASGVLVLCMGNALKVVDLLTSYNKEYIATARLGYETDTLDSTGNIIYESECKKFTHEEIEDTINSFIGESKQVVPKYSAIKVNGKRLYEYARTGIPVELPIRDINIYSIELIDNVISNNGYIEFSFKCSVSKGVYIRSLVRDIGRKLGTYATMTKLTRIRQGNFKIESSYTIDEILNDKYKILDIKDVLDMNKIVVDDDMAFRVRNGQVLNKFFKSDMALIMDKNNKLLAIYKNCENNKTRPYRVFN